MSFTGKLGTSLSLLAGIELAAAPAASPPPPTPTPPRPAFAKVLSRLAKSAHHTPSAEVLLFKGLYPVEALAGAAAAAASAADAYPYPFSAGPRRDGPHRRPLFVPDHRTYDPDPPVPPADQVYPPPFPVHSSVPGPWHRLDLGRLSTPRVPSPDAPAQFNPTSPPPPPPPQSGVIGSSRQRLPSIPRAPQVTDERIRPHIDKVAKLLNDLLRAGFVRTDDEGNFTIVGGGFSLPRAPAVTDDASVGAVLGGTFTNTLDREVYICFDNAVGSAVWLKIYPQ